MVIDPQVAWEKIGDASEIVSVERLKRNNRTSVFRLRRGSGHDIIAKRCREPVALSEELVYSFVDRDELRLPVLYGIFADPETVDEHKYYWLFLEDLGPNRHDPANASERGTLAAWLGTLGRLTLRAPSRLEGRVPVRDVSYYRTFLTPLLEELPRIFSARPFSAETRDAFGETARTLSIVEKRWAELDSLAGAAPSLLVHGDCLPKNVHVVDEPGRPVVPIDWGAAGIGPAGMDLGLSSISFEHADHFVPNVDAYVSAIRPAWPEADGGYVYRLAMAGRILWTIKLLAQSIPVFREHSSGKVETYFGLYARLLNSSAASIGWRDAA